MYFQKKKKNDGIEKKHFIAGFELRLTKNFNQILIFLNLLPVNDFNPKFTKTSHKNSKQKKHT
jgi:hypothetical protein